MKIKNLMINEYNMTNLDWLGYETDRFEYHHIIKKEYGGKETRENGAILGTTDHRYLHLIEYKDIEMYLYLNAILKVINTQGYMPTERQLKAIDGVLSQFEREHSGDRNAKGEELIKEGYTRRAIAYPIHHPL